MHSNERTHTHVHWCIYINILFFVLQYLHDVPQCYIVYQYNTTYLEFTRNGREKNTDGRERQRQNEKAEGLCVRRGGHQATLPDRVRFMSTCIEKGRTPPPPLPPTHRAAREMDWFVTRVDVCMCIYVCVYRAGGWVVGGWIHQEKTIDSLAVLANSVLSILYIVYLVRVHVCTHKSHCVVVGGHA